MGGAATATLLGSGRVWGSELGHEKIAPSSADGLSGVGGGLVESAAELVTLFSLWTRETPNTTGAKEGAGAVKGRALERSPLPAAVSRRLCRARGLLAVKLIEQAADTSALCATHSHSSGGGTACPRTWRTDRGRRAFDASPL